MSKKVDVSVERSATINCGNYSSIKPSVSLTIKDVDMENVQETYDKMSEALGTLMAYETIALGDEMETIQAIGFKEYLEALSSAKKDGSLDINYVGDLLGGK